MTPSTPGTGKSFRCFPILIVEDEPAHRLIIRKALEEGRIQNPIFEVDNGQKGLDFACGRGEYSDRKNYPSPGLILLDIKLPGMDGFEVLAALKGNDVTREIPVVMLTTSATGEDVRNSYRLGANAYLVKPVSSAELWEKLRVVKDFWLAVAEVPAQFS